jgi:hypothetical protein
VRSNERGIGEGAAKNQIDAVDLVRRRVAVQMRPMARAMAAGDRRNRPATMRATQVARARLGIRVRSERRKVVGE